MSQSRCTQRGRLWQPAAVNIRLKALLNTLQLPVKDVYSSKDGPEKRSFGEAHPAPIRVTQGLPTQTLLKGQN